MPGTVTPRPAKNVTDKQGRTRKAPLKPNESWTNPATGRTVKADRPAVAGRGGTRSAPAVLAHAAP